MIDFQGLKGMTPEQTSVLLDIKRLEKQATLTKLHLLRIFAQMCSMYRQAADTDFERLQEHIDVTVALSNSLQEEVNAVREAHGKATAFLEDNGSDDDHWDTAAEASSTVGGDASSVAGEPSSSVFDENAISSGSQEV